jgi:hypothetical protein
LLYNKGTRKNVCFIDLYSVSHEPFSTKYGTYFVYAHSYISSQGKWSMFYFLLKNLNEWIGPWLSPLRFNITWITSVLIMGPWDVYLASVKLSLQLSVYLRFVFEVNMTMLSYLLPNFRRSLSFRFSLTFSWKADTEYSLQTNERTVINNTIASTWKRICHREHIENDWNDNCFFTFQYNLAVVLEILTLQD